MMKCKYHQQCYRTILTIIVLPLRLSCSNNNNLAFVPNHLHRPLLFKSIHQKPNLLMSTINGSSETSANRYNSVHVAKTGGLGAPLASQEAAQKQLSLGAPKYPRPSGGHYLTKKGVQLTANVEQLKFVAERGVLNEGKGDDLGSSTRAIADLVEKLDERKGVLLTSSYEFPGRYARWSLGFVNPPLEVSGTGQKCTIRALNTRGQILLPAIYKALNQFQEEEQDPPIISSISTPPSPQTGTGVADIGYTQIDVTVSDPPEAGTFSEEDRSRQGSLFSVLRCLTDLFHYKGGDGQLGFYGAFGYDLTFQFEPIDLKQKRDGDQRDLLLYLPDEILVVDQDKRDAWTIRYEFCVEGRTTQGLSREEGEDSKFTSFQDGTPFQERDTPQFEFSKSVERAKKEFVAGNLFEVVLSQTFNSKLPPETPPSTLFKRLRARNPSPYGFFINLGDNEFLVGASPEMFVRCEETGEYGGALRVETCPISGTVARGADVLEDAERVKSLLKNEKEESELTMCTDVDRNDKSRISIPNSVQVIGRRQIEIYSRLIHTVDHVESYLRPKFDALDAFLCHTWAVTVTGAPKTWAIQFVENNERSSRCWYGGAVGMVGFDGSLNTGLTLRTVHVKNGIASVRAGATLLNDSDPAAEEEETELKASAMRDAILHKSPEESTFHSNDKKTLGLGKSIILLDHQDSFVHTLGNYLRQTGAEVSTLRSGPVALKSIEKLIRDGKKPDMVILSPGPGTPSDFDLSKSLDFLVKNRIPAFGVCLGLQGMVEHFGGTLGILNYPMHGKPSMVNLTPAAESDDSMFVGLPKSFRVARYHSLYALGEHLPSCFEVMANSDDGVVMAIQHKTLPLAAVQFHPESILTQHKNGMTILGNALKFLNFPHDSDADNGGTSGAEIVKELEELEDSELERRLVSLGLSERGTKSERVVKLALWTHKMNEAKGGRLDLDDMTLSQLKELKRGLGLKGSAQTKANLVEALQECLNQ